MASTYKHGVYVSEIATSVVAPLEATASIQVVVGTAPVNTLADPSAAVNTPILAYSYKEAVQALGYSDDFEHYTLSESIKASFQVLNVAPIILINVLDPSNEKHTAEMKETEAIVKGGVAVLNEPGILIKDLVVKTEKEPEDEQTLSQGTDYTTSFNDDGSLTIVVLKQDIKDNDKLKVSGKKLDPSKITEADIVGSVSSETGKETGLEVIRQIYPRLGLTPGIILAPRWSRYATVSAALQAKTKEINGVFRAVCFVDIDSSGSGCKKYTDVKTFKEKQALSDPNAYAIWPYAYLGDGESKTIFSGSALAAALTQYTDAQNQDTPNVSPSNKSIPISGACLADGTEVIMDQDQANTINSFGVATWVNLEGYKLWGNNTCCYPSNTDAKDRWLSVRRFMNWRANSFIRTYFQRIDAPMNPRLIESIVASERVTGNAFVARGVCAGYEITYNEDENPVTNLLNGVLTFHMKVTPYPPAEVIEDILEFDPTALSTALAAA